MAENTWKNFVYSVEAVFLANPGPENNEAAKKFYDQLVKESESWPEAEEWQKAEKLLEASYEILQKMRSDGEITSVQYNALFKHLGESVETTARILKEQAESGGEKIKRKSEIDGIVDTTMGRRGQSKL